MQENFADMLSRIHDTIIIFCHELVHTIHFSLVQLDKN